LKFADLIRILVAKAAMENIKWTLVRTQTQAGDLLQISAVEADSQCALRPDAIRWRKDKNCLQ
jgi:hypothetical protein